MSGPVNPPRRYDASGRRELARATRRAVLAAATTLFHERGYPEEAAFRELLTIMAGKLGIEYNQEAVDYLIEKHYHAVNRPLRCCQPRDLILQIRNYCRYVKQPLVMSQENFDFAVENYFAVM
jgi:hypothetical protein